MRKLELGLLTMALFAASQAACGGGPAKSDGSIVGIDGPANDGPANDGSANDGPANDAGNAADFVTGDADGTTFRAALMPQAGLQGLADGMIWMTAGTTSTTRGWTVYIPNSVGTHVCTMQTWIMLLETVGGRTDAQGAGCSVTVTRAAPALDDVIEGTFTATLGSLSSAGPLITVTNGAFHVTRSHD